MLIKREKRLERRTQNLLKKRTKVKRWVQASLAFSCLWILSSESSPFAHLHSQTSRSSLLQSPRQFISGFRLKTRNEEVKVTCENNTVFIPKNNDFRPSSLPFVESVYRTEGRWKYTSGSLFEKRKQKWLRNGRKNLKVVHQKGWRGSCRNARSILSFRDSYFSFLSASNAAIASIQSSKVQKKRIELSEREEE